MPPLFWLDVIALSIATVVTTSMALIELGTGLKRALNRFCVLYLLMGTVWAVSNLLWRPDLAALPGLVMILGLFIPLFYSQLIINFHLHSQGIMFIALGNELFQRSCHEPDGTPPLMKISNLTLGA